MWLQVFLLQHTDTILLILDLKRFVFGRKRNPDIAMDDEYQWMATTNLTVLHDEEAELEDEADFACERLLHVAHLVLRHVGGRVVKHLLAANGQSGQSGGIPVGGVEGRGLRVEGRGGGRDENQEVEK
jgi:hypothetical protein